MKNKGETKAKAKTPPKKKSEREKELIILMLAVNLEMSQWQCQDEQRMKNIAERQSERTNRKKMSPKIYCYDDDAVKIYYRVYATKVEPASQHDSEMQTEKSPAIESTANARVEQTNDYRRRGGCRNGTQKQIDTQRAHKQPERKTKHFCTKLSLD